MAERENRRPAADRRRVAAAGRMVQLHSPKPESVLFHAGAFILREDVVEVNRACRGFHFWMFVELCAVGKEFSGEGHQPHVLTAFDKVIDVKLIALELPWHPRGIEKPQGGGAGTRPEHPRAQVRVLGRSSTV